MHDSCTLFIKHLPREFNSEDRKEMLKLLGAVKVNVMPDSGKLKYSAFASFSSPEDAKCALAILHQREILGRRITAEFSKVQHDTFIPHQSDFPDFKYQPTKEKTEPSDREILKKDMEEFSKKIHSISYTLGLDYLPNPLLKYKYPLPSPTVLQNIGHALATVPKFYTQVLHLMNKMNLPAPFGPLTPAPPVVPDTPMISVDTYDLNETVKDEYINMESSEESEYESDDASKPKVTEKVLPLQKRKMEKPKIKMKRQKLVDLKSQPSNHSRQPIDPSVVFESLPLSQKKINVKKINQLTPSFVNFETTEGFGAIEISKNIEPDKSEKSCLDTEHQNDTRFISVSELRKKRLSSREMKSMSIFKNISEGQPTFRLYIKNLAKQVSEKDLTYIFGRFINWDSEEEKNMFDVRLMKEGRMKGQAFVTLASEAQAIEAVEETNGFVLHTKPLVVQFARSAKPKDNEKKN